MRRFNNGYIKALITLFPDVKFDPSKFSNVSSMMSLIDKYNHSHLFQEITGAM